MILRKVIIIVFSLVLCIGANVAYIEPVLAEGYDFSERLVYGGNALDIGKYIYFNEPNEGKRLYRKLVGSEEVELIYNSDASYLNYSGGRIIFISRNRIISINTEGGDDKVLYNSEKTITHLYAAPECLYFLCDGEVIRYYNGRKTTVVASEEICAFLPLSKEEFVLYTENPEYTEIDQSGSEIYNETQDKYLKYTYDAKTTASIAFTLESYSASASAQYSGPFVEIGDITLPLAEYMPGSFFTKNGQACTCHYVHNIDCVASVSGCNCMRYWPTGVAATCEVDLLGAQCFAFARFVFYKCFGFIDHAYLNPGRFYNVGNLSSGSVTVNSVKSLLMQANTGAHVRLTRGHSVSILTMDEDFIVIYHGNAGGDGVLSQPCVVSTRRYTWAEFAAYAAAGISYINMPYDYPGETVIPPKVYSEGYYQITGVINTLNVRSGAGLGYSIIGSVGINSYVNVLEVNGIWGVINYNGSVGWVCLDYATFSTLSVVTPSESSPFSTDRVDGLLIGAAEKIDINYFTGSFTNQSLVIYNKEGKKINEDGIYNGTYIGTGCVVAIELDGVVLDSKTVVIVGDINGNGIVDVGDYLATRRIYLGSYQAQEAYLIAADINGDGIVDAKDCLTVKRYLLGIAE